MLRSTVYNIVRATAPSGVATREASDVKAPGMQERFNTRKRQKTQEGSTKD